MASRHTRQRPASLVELTSSDPVSSEESLSDNETQETYQQDSDAKSDDDYLGPRGESDESDSDSDESEFDESEFDESEPDESEPDERRSTIDDSVEPVLTTQDMGAPPLGSVQGHERSPTNGFEGDHCDDIAAEYRREYNEAGYHRLAKAVIRRVVTHTNTVNGTQRQSFLWASYDYLRSLDRDLLDQVIDGNLALANRTNPAIKAVLKKQAKWAKQAPCIYVRLLVHYDGTALTPKELQNLVNIIRDYRKDPVVASKIDGSSAKDAKAGYRRFLNHRDPPYCPIGRQNEDLDNFCRGIEHRISRYKDKMDEPMKSPLSYYGYATDYATRKRQHDKGQSSSWLMRMVSWVTHQHPLFRQKRVRFSSYVVGLNWKHLQSRVGEILLTFIGQGNIINGGGVCIWNPGQNSNNPYNEQQWREVERYLKNRLQQRKAENLAKDRQILEGFIKRAKKAREGGDEIRSQIRELINSTAEPIRSFLQTMTTSSKEEQEAKLAQLADIAVQYRERAKEYNQDIAKLQMVIEDYLGHEGKVLDAFRAVGVEIPGVDVSGFDDQGAE
ncbi:hypothetical protein K490DRAFT_57112 [Saccharata proteae CBS 121410]|uniref:Uncharacterized protein n=1 Tax=Saccharata proteae CBS 121410 TaxID=1314787 RepID=A0A9P4HUL3_9PEZI|nr:hypothetical protein K490DRAFT_57112 [Saccharata proteae CBS 121410]